MPPLPKSAPNLGEEQALVEACRRGEQAALHVFYERYRRRVFSLIARIVGAQDAEELAQEVFLRAFRGLEKFRGDAQLSTWMYRLAVNAALSHATRTQARQRRDLGEDALMALPAEDAPATDPRLRARLERALHALPAGYRAVLVLHDIEGLQHEEIAHILGCRVGTSKSQLHKARAKMRDLLGGAP
ncbi:MAG: polymerase, sigma-24 subunit, subfamily [Myxococcales bacterium]|nr:polymerase, sigma-24 subunit, subfamily [Myxococcales bacterium]